MQINGEKFAVLIPTHGRAGNVDTIGTLRKAGYTGEIYFVIDDEDEQGTEYRKLYGEDKVITFCKEEWMRKTDAMDNLKKHAAVVYARNAMNDIAKSLGLKKYLVLDDDYTYFGFRYAKDNKLARADVKNFDRICELFCKYLDISQARTVCLAQGGGLHRRIGRGILSQRIIEKSNECVLY